MKKTLKYPVVYHSEPEGGYTVTFPDFPGCVTFGESLEQAEAMAKEALELWLEELASAHEDIPEESGRSLLGQVAVSVQA